MRHRFVRPLLLAGGIGIFGTAPAGAGFVEAYVAANGGCELFREQIGREIGGPQPFDRPPAGWEPRDVNELEAIGLSCVAGPPPIMPGSPGARFKLAVADFRRSVDEARRLNHVADGDREMDSRIATSQAQDRARQERDRAEAERAYQSAGKRPTDGAEVSTNEGVAALRALKREIDRSEAEHQAQQARSPYAECARLFPRNIQPGEYDQCFSEVKDKERRQAEEAAERARNPDVGQIFLDMSSDWVVGDKGPNPLRLLTMNGVRVGAITIPCDGTAVERVMPGTMPGRQIVIGLDNKDYGRKFSNGTQELRVKSEAQTPALLAYGTGEALIAYSGSDFEGFEKLLLASNLFVTTASGKIVAELKSSGDKPAQTSVGQSPSGFAKPASPIAFLRGCEARKMPEAGSRHYQICHPRGNPEMLANALGQAMILRRQAQACERTFGQYAEHVSQLNAYADDLESALVEQGASGQIQVVKDKDAAAGQLLGWAMEGGRTNRQYRECESIRMNYGLSKSLVCIAK